MTTIDANFDFQVRDHIPLKLNATVVDLFFGAGGLSHGFHSERFDIVGGIDTDEMCRYAFEHNNDAPFIMRDVAGLNGCEITELFNPGKRGVLVGCASCQPFSTYNQKSDDPKWRLLSHFSNLIDEVRPDIISMENVHRLLEFKEGAVALYVSSTKISAKQAADAIRGHWGIENRNHYVRLQSALNSPAGLS